MGKVWSGKMVAYILAFLALLSVVAAIWYVAARVPLEDIRLDHDQPKAFASGWSLQTAEGLRELDEPSRLAAGNISGTLLLTNILPESQAGHQYLAFQTKNETVRVWVGHELVYCYGESPQLIYGHGVGAVWHLAPLPGDSGGQPVLVELIPVDGRTGLAPYEFMLGGRDAIIFQLIRDSLPMIVICLMLASIGVGALVIAVVGLARHSRPAAMAYFAVFVLLSSIWTATDSGLLQFVLNNKGVSYLLFGCSFYFLCTPFMLFIAAVDPRNQKTYWVLSAVNSLYALVRVVLYMAGAVDFEAALWLLHILMGVIMVIVNINLWRPVYRTGRLQEPALCLAISAFTLIGFASLLSFYINDKLDMLRCGYSSGFYTGILIFVIITAIGALQKARRLRQQAFRSEFFERRAYTDDLTGLLSIKGFDDKCAAVLERSSPGGPCYAVLDFDVNYFSQYNANNGVEAGDKLLQRIADILRSYCYPDELCARQEADHFLCLLKGESFPDILERVRQADYSVRSHMRMNLLLLSYGLVEVTDSSLNPTALRNQALVAKRQVKGNYEDNIAIYDRSLHESQLQEMALLSGFEEALEREEYVIFLQPKIDVVTEGLRGAEALIRRVDADGSIMAAGTIVEVLERKGFVAKLDYYVLELVCRMLRRCLDQGRSICPISSNFSRVHLYAPDFPERVAAIADRYHIPHELLEIELTESVFLAGKDILQKMVHALHEAGFQVSIDDFGSGYSSLNMLKDVEVNAIKLDREFLADFADDSRAGTVVEYTLRLAQQLQITSVAEGIETERQLQLLRRLGCDLVQGFYYSHPLPEEDFVARYLPLAGAEE